MISVIVLPDSLKIQNEVNEMIKLTPWQDAIALPVNSQPARWSFRTLERILTESIRRCAQFSLERDSGIATTLSGGLDSSFCLAKIREIYGEGIKIFTFTVGGSTRHPDIRYARIISKKFRTIHLEIIPEPELLIEAEAVLKTTRPSVVPGDVAIFLAYQRMATFEFRTAIAHDGIDELLGGYRDHQIRVGKEREAAFENSWARLGTEHLLPLETSAVHFGIQVALPYLQREVVRYISRIPLDERTTQESSKIPLREIARKYLPGEVIERRKYGFCSAFDT